MIIRFFANLREITGPERVVEIEKATVKDVLTILGDIHGEAFLNAVYDADGELYVRILVNGRNIDYLCGLESIVLGSDMIFIFPPIAGGSHERL